MSNVLRLAIVDPNEDTRDTLKAMLLGMDTVWLEAECSRYEFFADVIDQTHPEIGIVVLDGDQQKAIELVAGLGQSAPECHILVISKSCDGDLILQAMRAGAKEFLTQPVKVQDIASALDRITKNTFGKDQRRIRGCSVIAVAGATGGVGSTSLAVNLGCILAKDSDNSVALLDLDMCLGDADVFLDTIPEYTLLHVAQNATRLDFTLLKRSLTKHASGLYLLPRPAQLQSRSMITADDLHHVIGLLKATFSHLVIDLSKSYNSLDQQALQEADHVLLVTQLDLPCLRNVVQLMVSFGEMGDLKEKVKLVINRVGLDNNISLKKAQDTIGDDIFWQLPNDYRLMVEVRNNGVPLIEQAPKAGITGSMVALAQALNGNPAEKTTDQMPSTGGRRWLNFLSSKN